MSWHKDFNSQRFAIVPLEALLDKRLKPRHLAALAALALHANKDGDVRCTLATLVEITGNPGDGNMSNTISNLAEWGYVKSKKQIGFNGVNEYKLGAPDYNLADLREVQNRGMDDKEYAKIAAKNKEEGKAYAKSKPYVVQACDTDDNDSQALRLTEMQALKLWYAHVKHGEWPGFSPEYFDRWKLDREKMKALHGKDLTLPEYQE